MNWKSFDIRTLSDTEYLKWYSLMSNEKKLRVDGFRFDDAKKRTVAGEMLSRKMIAESCGIFPEKISFDKTEQGKPFAVDIDIHFNISHSGNMVVCAINEDPVGIDTELIRPVNLRITNRICSKAELMYIFDHLPEEKELVCSEDREILTRFFEVWTAKEAIVKYSGKGLSELSRVDSFAVNERHMEEDYVISIKYTI